MPDNINKKGIKAIVVAAALIAIYIILKYAFWTVFPFVFAFIISFLIRKLVVFLIKLTGLKPKEASFVLLLLCYILVFSSLYFALGFLTEKIIEFAQQFPDLYSKCIEPKISDIINCNTIQNSFLLSGIDEFKNIISSFIANFSGKIAGYALNIPDVLITVTVTIIASFFICLDYDNIKNNMLDFFPSKLKIKLTNLKRNVILSLSKMIKCYLIIFLVTFIELLIGLLMLRVEHSLIISLIIAFADFLPLIGTGTVLIPWAVISFFSGKSAMCIGLIALYLIITVVRNIMEPKLIGKNIGVHPLLTLAAMYIGLKLGGVVLAFLFPLCLLLFKTAKKQ